MAPSGRLKSTSPVCFVFQEHGYLKFGPSEFSRSNNLALFAGQFKSSFGENLVLLSNSPAQVLHFCVYDFEEWGQSIRHNPIDPARALIKNRPVQFLGQP